MIVFYPVDSAVSWRNHPVVDNSIGFDSDLIPLTIIYVVDKSIF